MNKLILTTVLVGSAALMSSCTVRETTYAPGYTPTYYNVATTYPAYNWGTRVYYPSNYYGSYYGYGLNRTYYGTGYRAAYWGGRSYYGRGWGGGWSRGWGGGWRR